MANHPHDANRPVRKKMAEAVERGDIKAIVKGLSPRQRRFCEEYVIDYNRSIPAGALRGEIAIFLSRS